MAITKWSRFKCRSGSGNVEVREENPPFHEKVNLVCLEADEAQLTEEAWDELCADVGVLLGRDAGSLEEVTKRFIHKLGEVWGDEPCTLEEAERMLNIDCHIQNSEVAMALAEVMALKLRRAD